MQRAFLVVLFGLIVAVMGAGCTSTQYDDERYVSELNASLNEIQPLLTLVGAANHDGRLDDARGYAREIVDVTTRYLNIIEPLKVSEQRAVSHAAYVACLRDLRESATLDILVYESPGSDKAVERVKESVALLERAGEELDTALENL